MRANSENPPGPKSGSDALPQKKWEGESPNETRGENGLDSTLAQKRMLLHRGHRGYYCSGKLLPTPASSSNRLLLMTACRTRGGSSARVGSSYAKPLIETLYCASWGRGNGRNAVGKVMGDRDLAVSALVWFT
jgi:hypothetical protein